MKRNVSLVFCVLALIMFSLSLAFTQEVGEGKKPVTVSISLFAEDLDFFQDQMTNATFKKMLPNVTLDFQTYKDSEEAIKTEKIQQAAGKMADLFYVKPGRLLELKESMTVFKKDDPLVKKNFAVEAFAVNLAPGGGYYGSPFKVFTEWVHYNKKVFKKLNLTIPKTFRQFIDLCVKIKKEGGGIIPLGIGAKDVWPVYPFTEFLPHTIANDPKLLSKMALVDNPFDPGTPFYKMCEMVAPLFQAGVTGDALDMDETTVLGMLGQGKVAMVPLGQYFYNWYTSVGGDINDIAVFPLPSSDDPVLAKRVIGLTDDYWSIYNKSQHKEAARKVLEWIFSPEVYTKYLTATANSSTIKGIAPKNMYTEALETYKPVVIYQNPGNEYFSKIQTATQFNEKDIGIAMMSGKDWKAYLADLNAKWKKARAEIKP